MSSAASHLLGPVLPRSAWGDALAWNREYESIQSIPSSLRTKPSHALIRLEPSLGDLKGAAVLDLGAGLGRHSTYLTSRGARVHAIDSSPIATELHRAQGDPTTVIELGTVRRGDLPDGMYDLIVDSYVSCHILSTEERFGFLGALMSRLKPGGRLYTSGMGVGDEFYSRHIVSGLPEPVAVDPRNEIAKLLQPEGISAHYQISLGNVVATTTEQFTDFVAGRLEHREVHAAVLQR